MTWRLLQGHVLDVLAALPEQSCHVCLTSPPYWGLRAYGTAPQVWGGAGDGCAHEWGDLPYAPQRDGGKGFVDGGKAKLLSYQGTPYTAPSATCTRCGAWRGELGSEPTIALYVAHIVEVFRAVWSVLRDDGTCWINLGDAYSGSYGNQGRKLERGTQRPINGPMLQPLADGRYPDQGSGTGRPTDGLKPKDLCGIPWRVALALQDDGWYLRSAITLCKVSPMPESVRDRPTQATELLFLLSKKARYFYDADAVRQPNTAGTLARFSAGEERSPGHKIFTRDQRDRAKDWAAVERCDGANLRNWWPWAPEPFSFAQAGRGYSGGSDRITSPDCPVHGDQPRRVSTGVGDGLLDASQSDRTEYTDARPEQSRLDAPAPIDSRPAADSAPDSSDLLGRGRVDSANGHSTESRRTVPVPETSPRGIDSVESLPHTADTEQVPDSDATSVRNPESSSAGDSASDARATRPAVRRAESSSGKCTCRIIDHFAVFPTFIPRTAILAGTSAHGVCARCAAPWRRLVEREMGQRQTRPGSNGQQVHPDGMGHTLTARTLGTVGWEPTCRCPTTEVRAATVLDPFAGSGTTLLVADRLGRHGLGIELSAKYCAMAEQRLAEDAPLVAAVEATEAWEQAALWEAADG